MAAEQGTVPRHLYDEAVAAASRMSGQIEELESLQEWTVRVREKFALTGKTQSTPGLPEFWRGYVACLADVERFAGGGEGVTS